MNTSARGTCVIIATLHVHGQPGIISVKSLVVRPGQSGFARERAGGAHKHAGAARRSHS